MLHVHVCVSCHLTISECYYLTTSVLSHLTISPSHLQSDKQIDYAIPANSKSLRFQHTLSQVRLALALALALPLTPSRRYVVRYTQE